MTAPQTPTLAFRSLERRNHYDNLVGLGAEDVRWANENSDAASALCSEAIRNRGRKPFILEPRILAIARTQHPESHFRTAETFFAKDAPVSITEYGSRFTDFFTGKVERHPLRRLLVPFMLVRGANDREVIRDVGGPGKAEVSLAEIWHILERHTRGEETGLLRSNLFFARDRLGELRLVHFVARPKNGWHAGARPIGSFWQHHTDRFFFPVL